ncbi:MAG: hypothetical protein ACXWZG_09140 [Microbacterium sp.]
MTPSARHLPVLLLGAASALVLAACASGAGSGQSSAVPFGTTLPGLPSGEVIGQGTVMDIGGAAELCVGPIAESYPPQCSGIPLTNWTWEGIEGSESSGDVTWGAYAVQGTYDGEEFTVTQPPIMLALYDPMPFPDPTDGKAGAGAEAELLAIQEELPGRLQDAYLSSYPENGYLWIDVVWDDGTWQDAADQEFGDDVVVVRSALREVEG